MDWSCGGNAHGLYGIREIADGLVISVTTVSTHVGNILDKTGAANWANAASFATRIGLA